MCWTTPNNLRFKSPKWGWFSSYFSAMMFWVCLLMVSTFNFQLSFICTFSSYLALQCFLLMFFFVVFYVTRLYVSVSDQFDNFQYAGFPRMAEPIELGCTYIFKVLEFVNKYKNDKNKLFRLDRWVISKT